VASADTFQEIVETEVAVVAAFERPVMTMMIKTEEEEDRVREAVVVTDDQVTAALDQDHVTDVILESVEMASQKRGLVLGHDQKKSARNVIRDRGLEAIDEKRNRDQGLVELAGQYLSRESKTQLKMEIPKME